MRNLDSAQPDEKPGATGDDLPEGWASTALGIIGEYVNGRAFKSSEWSDNGRPIIRIQDLTKSKENPNYYKGEIEPRYIVHPGDLLISWSATLGAYIWEGPEGVLNQHIFKVQSYLDRRFHFYLAQQFLADLRRQTHGSGLVHVTKSDFTDTPVAIPPLAEQSRIVANIDRLLLHVNDASDHLSRVPAILKRFRQAVLAAACSGRLTEDWRASHASSSQKGQLSDSELPECWDEQPIEQLCRKITDGEHLNPHPTPQGIPLLSAKDVREEGVSFDDPKFVSPSDAERFRKRCNPENGDVLIVSRGATIGRVTNVLTNRVFCLMGSVILLKTRPTLNSRYLTLFLASPTGQERLIALSGYTAQQAIYLRDTRTLPIPVPSLVEQEEIVRRTDALLHVAERIARKVAAAAERADKLTQSILAKAFRGELVPTEAELARREGREYEPASVLLQRIKTVRTLAVRGNKVAESPTSPRRPSRNVSATLSRRK